MEATNLGDLLRRSCTTWPDRPAMMFSEGKEFKTLTYRDLWQKVRQYAGAVRALGLEKGDTVAIQSENCPEWALIDWACRCLGIMLVPVYPTLPADQTQYIVGDCGAKLVFSSSSEQAAKVQGLDVRCLLMKDGDEAFDKLVEKHGGDVSEEELNRAIDAVGSEDVATLIYTSGTTGPPKGAMLSHKNFCFICEAALQSLPIKESDVFLCFLPMSHVYERVAGQTLPIHCGSAIAYAKSLMSLATDIVKVKPTIMLCVPRFLEATQDKITDAAKKQGGLKSKLFGWALAQNDAKHSGGFAPFAGLLDGLVGAKIREKMGGRIRFFVSGGAALPDHVARFYRAFGLKILQGYGLTETTAASCVNHPDDVRTHTVGPPIPGVEIKIAADGEILIRGGSRMIGYHKLPKETAEALDAEGWFHTGDIGEFEGTHLKITDRKKDLLVLANGKNVAPQPIENKLKESPLIAEVVLFGDGSEYVYGLVIPNFERLREQMADVGVSGATNADLVTLDSVKARIKGEVDRINKGLADFEKVKKHALVDAVFSVESGELTPSLKVKRKVVKENFAAVLDTMKR